VRLGELGRDFDDYVVSRSPPLLRTAVLLCGGDVHTGEDLLQQALVRLAGQWRRGLDHPDAYVRRTLVNLSRDRHRRLTRRAREAAWPAGDDNFVSPAMSSDTDPDADGLLEALRGLPARQRATLVLRFWDDLSVADTAAALDCSPGTVKSNTSRGLDRLRAILEGETSADRR
jgi:RNA polymerase sigma-70 factor (sigma-E family)